MIYIILGLILALAITCFLSAKPLKQKIKSKIRKEKSEGKENESLEHSYAESKSSGLLFCNVCKKLLFSLWGPQYHECLICGIYVHKKCRKNQIQCKFIKSSENELSHQWLSGNLPVNSICCHCGLTCGYFFDLEGKSCLWCQKVVHEECKDKVNQQCDFGEFKDAIILPNGNFTKPIIVVINQKSGGQVGVDFYKSFLRFLNPIQVLNIQEMDKLKKFAHIKTAKLITAGGDGTVASVINYIKEFDWNPPIAILPLGTGNDLSRALGWGGTYEQLDASHVLQKIMSNENITLLDRWNVKIGNKNYKLFNYFGIGLDAKFCYDFHNLRQSSPQWFKSRLGNKLIYTQMGLNDLIKNEKSGLGKRIKVICDDQVVDIPDQVENVIILNINSWSGGVTGLWEQDADFKQQKMNDGLLEIIGVTSILHLGRIQVGLDKPYQLGQGRKIQIIYPSNSYVQIDGEPLSIGPSIIDISLVDKVQVLTNYELTWENRFLKTMEWAEEQNHITKQAKDEIVNRIKMGITEQDLLPLKKIKVPLEYENDSQFYQEAIMKQYEKRRQRLLSEYNDLLNKKSEETQIHTKSLPPEDKQEDSNSSRINDKLLKMKKFQQNFREQQLVQYSQKEQQIETRRKQISSERELRAYQKEVQDTSRLEQIQRNRDMIQKLITDKQVKRRMSYDAKLQKWELLKQAQYLIPRSTRVDETLARYQKCLEEKKQQDMQRLKRLEESLEKASSKKTQNIVEIKRRGLLEQLKIEEALFNRARSQNAKNTNIQEKTPQKTVLIRPSMSEIPKQKPFPQPKFLFSKQQMKLNSQTISHFSQEIISLVDSINIHDIEEKLLQVFATQDKTQRELFAKINYLFLYQ